MFNNILLVAALAGGEAQANTYLEPAALVAPADTTVSGSATCTIECKDGQCRTIKCSGTVQAESSSAAKRKLRSELTFELEREASRLGGSIKGSIIFSF